MIKKLIFACVTAALLTACATDDGLSDANAKRAADINARLGVGYMRQGKYDIAKEKLEKALSQDPSNGDIYHYLAELYRRVDEPELAEQNYQKAMDINENDSALRNNYGVFLCGEKKFKQAQKYFDKVMDDPVYQRKDLVYENMGLCAQSQGNLLLAEKYLNKAMEMNPRLPTTVLTLAQMSFDKQQFQLANFHFKRYESFAPHTPQSLWLGYLLAMQGDNKNQAASYAILLKGKFPDARETKLLRKLESRK